MHFALLNFSQWTWQHVAILGCNTWFPNFTCMLYRESKREVSHRICGVQAIIMYDECVVHQPNCKFGIAKLGLGK